RVPQVGERREEDERTHVLGSAASVVVRDVAHDLEEVGVVEIASPVELRLQPQVVQRADDRAAGDRRDHLDLAKEAELGELCEHADVEEGGTMAPAREGEAELRYLLLRLRRVHGAAASR